MKDTTPPTARQKHLQSISPTHSPSLPAPLSVKEKQVLEFLELYVKTKGISPTYQEICGHFGFASFNSAQRYLRQLESKGYLRLPGSNQKRAITLLQASTSIQTALENLHDGSTNEYKTSAHAMPRKAAVQSAPEFTNTESLNLPLLGRVAAGAPIEAFEHDEFIDVPSSLVRHADRTYALRVQGQSMIEDGILDDDVILVQRQSYASNGEIIVAVVGEEATVKRFYMHTVDPRERASNDGDDSPTRSLQTNRRMIELRPANSTMSSLWFEPGEVQIRGIVVGLIRKF